MIVTWFTMPEALPASLFISLDWLVRTLIRFVRGVLRARDVFHLDAQVATTERLATLIAASVGLFAGRTLLAFTLGFLIGRIIALSFCLWVYLRLGERLWIGFQYREWRTILRNSLPMGLRGMLRVVSFRVDAVILGLLRPSQEVGWYGAAYQFVEVSFFFQEAIGGSFQPAIARASGRGLQGMVSDLYGRAYKLILTISGLGAAIGFVYAGRLVALAFGDNYVNSTPALRILIWVMLLVPSWMMSVVLLDAVGSQAKTVRPFFVSVAGTILLNLFLIQQVGFLGAAWSTLLTEFFLTITLLRTSFNLGYRFPLTWLVGPVVACGAFTAVASMLHSSLILGAGLGLAAFLTTLVVFGVFDEVDRGYGQLLFKKVMNLARRQYVS
jgi:O-antigen/teichoic acid export membrane protein